MSESETNGNLDASGQARSGHGAAIATAVIDLGDYWQGPVGGDSARSNSRYADRQIGRHPLVLRMAARLSECQWVDRIYAVGCNLPESVMRIRSAFFEPISLPSCHLVERLGAAVDRAGSDWIVHVPANRPFVDAGLIDGLLAKAARTQGCDYVAYVSNSDSHARLDHLGLDGEVCHAEMIRRLCRNADRLSEANSISDCLYDAPGTYQVKYVPIPRALDHCELRFAIENENDWDDAQLLCDSIADIDVDWHQVAGLMRSNNRLQAGVAAPAE